MGYGNYRICGLAAVLAGRTEERSVLERRGMCCGGQRQIIRQQADQEQIVERLRIEGEGQGVGRLGIAQPVSGELGGREAADLA